MIAPPFVLASGSPRRKLLLEQAGYQFTVQPSNVPEPDPVYFPSPQAYVSHTAWLKVQSVACRSTDTVLAADTVAALDGAIIGKPADEEDARRILHQLNGTRHFVHTGVCLHLAGPRVLLSDVATSCVEMKALRPAEIEAYLKTGLWRGKAGAYGIQDRDDPFVATVEGSYSNVMGLPMERLEELFALAARCARPAGSD